ncbi:MAG: hypothetical protein JJU02_12155 [Cryomorphaceae bacterium]|nr:hypothetical protein [Cryomorphaceae bacterium]
MFILRYINFGIRAIIVLVLFISCKKEKPLNPVTQDIPVVFTWANQPLLFQKSGYSLFSDCCSGYEVRVSRLQLFISNPIVDSSLSTVNKYIYIDLALEDYQFITVKKMPNEPIKFLNFIAGLAPEANQTDYLGNNFMYQNMFWPDPMGGGYHHLKFEGRITGQEESWGFAFHTGKIGFETPIKLEGQGNAIQIDAKRWFDGFSPEDSLWNTMYHDDLMLFLSKNTKNVFSWKP